MGGIGICQITSPRPTDDQVWSWKANVAAGWAMYQQKRAAAQRYPEQVRHGQEFKTLVKAFNEERQENNNTAPRLPIPSSPLRALDVDLPDYDETQLERDTLRGFNGYAGGLHEYRPKVDGKGRLVVVVVPGGVKATAEWERISASARSAYYDSIQLPQSRRGDVNYVEDVEREQSF